MTVLSKYASERMPLIFDFTSRLGELAPGARILEPVLSLSCTPTGNDDDLYIGALEEAIVDPVEELAVQVLAEAGRSGVVYRPACRVAVAHAGHEYEFEVQLTVFVR